MLISHWGTIILPVVVAILMKDLQTDPEKGCTAFVELGRSIVLRLLDRKAKNHCLLYTLSYNSERHSIQKQSQS